MLQALFNRPYKQAVIMRLSGRQPDCPLPGGGGFEKVLHQALFSCLGRVTLLKAGAPGGQVDFATRLMTLLALDSDARHQAIDNFNLGKQPRADVLALVVILVRHSGVRHDLLAEFLKCQGKAAQLDGRLGFPERILLRDIGELCGFSKQEVYNFCFVGPAQEVHSGRRHELDRAYATLQLSCEADERQIKQAYRRLAAQYHPDKVQAQGHSATTLRLATEQFADLQEAYELLCGARKMRA